MSWATQSFQGAGASGFYPDGITSSKPWYVASELKDGSNPQELDQEHISLVVEYDIEGKGTLKSTTSYSNDDVSFVVDLDTGTSPSCKAAFVCLDFWQDYPSETIQQEFIFTSEQMDKLSYVVGVYYYETEAVFGFNVNPVIVNGYADRTRSGFNFIGHSTDFIESRAIFGEINYASVDLRFNDLNWIDGDIFELEGNYNVNENLQIYGTFSYLKSEYGNYSSTAYQLPMTAAGFASNEVINLDGRQLIIAPEYTGSLGFNYQRMISSGLLELNGNFYYSDEFWFDFLERVNPGSYNTLAASVSLTPNFNENIKLSLFGRNLTNEEYFASSLLGPSSDAPVYMPPRMIGVSLDYNF